MTSPLAAAIAAWRALSEEEREAVFFALGHGSDVEIDADRRKEAVAEEGEGVTRPYYQHAGITIWHGDCREVLQSLGGIYDAIVVDPPYGETSLGWDVRFPDWIGQVSKVVASSGSMWCFGSLRMLTSLWPAFEAEWTYAQEIVWEKHNGSNSAADRFRRVHEFAVQFYSRGLPWSHIYKQPVTTPDATKRTVRRKKRPPQWGEIGPHSYESHDGGPRLMRSVLRIRSMHGTAVHPTQKPTALVRPLIEYSCPPGGIVLDPFMGSGTTLVAALEVGRQAVGVEIDERYCEEAAKRLAQGVLPGCYAGATTPSEPSENGESHRSTSAMNGSIPRTPSE